MLTRYNQVIAALAWAEGIPGRHVTIIVDNGKPIKLSIVETRGNNFYCVLPTLEDGDDFSALLDAKERETDQQELLRLQMKLGGKHAKI